MRQANQDEKTVLILTDSQAAVASMERLGRGEPPRSKVEAAILQQLVRRRRQDHKTWVAWIRSHIGIPGNEAADAIAKAHAREPRGPDLQPITHEGLKAEAQKEARQLRFQPGFGRDRLKWDRTALGAYTQLRTERGPFGAWLHKIGEADNPWCTHEDCEGKEEPESGEHLTFECRRFSEARGKLGEDPRWEDLDRPVWIGTEDNKQDAVRALFNEVGRYLAGRRRRQG